jgi:hypothetical protein
VAQQRETIDLRTLQEVHRLLASSDFATADDRRGRGADTPVIEAASLAHHPEHLEAGSMAPLPRRH